MNFKNTLKAEIELSKKCDNSDSLLKNIAAELTKHRANGIQYHNNELTFKSGFLKTEFNPLTGISRGAINVTSINNKFLVNYALDLKDLLIWATLATITVLVFGLNSIEEPTLEQTIAVVIGAIVAYLFIYFGYYGIISVRFNHLINRANKISRQAK